MRTYYERSNKEYNQASRYRVLRVINDGTNRYLETQNPKVIPNDDDTYHIVSSNEVNRLDIIANKHYGDPSYWWVIALANDMLDPFILNQGDMIRIPSLTSLVGFNQDILYKDDTRGVLPDELYLF